MAHLNPFRRLLGLPAHLAGLIALNRSFTAIQREQREIARCRAERAARIARRNQENPDGHTS